MLGAQSSVSIYFITSREFTTSDYLGDIQLDMCEGRSTYYACGCWKSHSNTKCSDGLCKTVRICSETLKEIKCERRTLKDECQLVAAERKAGRRR